MLVNLPTEHSDKPVTSFGGITLMKRFVDHGPCGISFHYLADLKVSPQARGNRVLASLMLVSPLLQSLPRSMILRISAGQGRALSYTTSPLPKPACIMTGGQREQRSLMSPIRIADSAWLEDTRRGKRLWRSDGKELISAHLGSFYFQEAAE